MGRQVNFFLHRQDLHGFEAFFWSSDAVVALCQPTPSADLVAASSLRPEAENQLRPWPIMFLARDADLSLIRVKLIERQGYFLIDTLRSPVIEWSPPIWVRRNWKKGPSGSYESPAARPG